MDNDVHLSRSRHLKTTPPMHVGSQQPLVGCLPNMHGWHTSVANSRGNIFGNVSGLLLGDHACAMPHHHHGLQKRLLPLLQVIVMTLYRSLPLSKCVKGKVCARLGSDYYYKEFVSSTSSAVLRSATPIKTAL